METCKCSCEWKLSGSCTLGNTKWNNGFIVLNTKMLDLSCHKSVRPETATYSVNLFKKKMKKVTAKASRLMILFLSGENLQLCSPSKPYEFTQMSEVLLDLLRKTETGSLEKPLKSVRDFRQDKSPRSPARVALTFTEMKSKGSSIHDDKDSTPASTPKSSKYLEKSQVKSAQTLSVLPSANFYGTSTPAVNRHDNQDLHRSAPPSFRYSKSKPGFLSDLVGKNVSYTWQKEKSTPTKDQPVKQETLQGFSNLGNTCYMNSILQSLFSIENFARDLERTANNLQNKFSQNKQSSGLLGALSRLLKAHRSCASWEKLSFLLAGVKKAISAKCFLGNEQHDAHEFLSQVLDQLKEEVIALNKELTSDLCPSPSHTTDEHGSIKNPVLENFEFKVAHTIQCLKCEETVVKEETFNDLSLDLPRRKDMFEEKTIQDALDQFFRKEKIDYSCDKCDSKEAFVTHHFTSLPRILIIHLKRYVFMSTSSAHSKLGRQIGVPRYLCLHGQCNYDTHTPTETSQDLTKNQSVGTTCIEHQENVKPFKFNSSSTPKTNFKFRHPKRPVNGDHFKEDSTHEALGKRRRESSPRAQREIKMAAKDGLSDFHLDGKTEDEQFRLALERSTSENFPTVSFENSPIGKTSLTQPAWMNTAPLITQVDGTRDSSPEIPLEGNDEEKLTLFLEESCSSEENVPPNEDSVISCEDHADSCEDNIDVSDDKLRERSIAEGQRRLRSLVQVDGPSDGQNESDDDLSACCSTSDTKIDEKQEDFSKVTFKDLVLRDSNSSDCDKTCPGFEMTPAKNDEVIFTQSRATGEPSSTLVKGENSMFQDHDYSEKCNGIEQNTEDLGATPVKNDGHQDASNDLEEALKRSRADQDREEAEFQAALERAKEMSLMEFNSVTEDLLEKDIEEEADFKTEVSASDREWQKRVKENAKSGQLKNSYSLLSVVSHLGSSSKVGHYVSDIYNMSKREWYTCDDSTVALTSEEKVLSGCQRSGYIFFYIHKDVFDKFSSHLKSSSSLGSRVPLSPSRPNMARNTKTNR